MFGGVEGGRGAERGGGDQGGCLEDVLFAEEGVECVGEGVVEEKVGEGGGGVGEEEEGRGLCV